MPEQVWCYAGAFYPERPQAFTWQGGRLDVSQVVSRWRSPGGACFRVRLEDNRLFDLCYIESEDSWRVAPCAAAAGTERNSQAVHFLPEEPT